MRAKPAKRMRIIKYTATERAAMAFDKATKPARVSLRLIARKLKNAAVETWQKLRKLHKKTKFTIVASFHRMRNWLRSLRFWGPPPC